MVKDTILAPAPVKEAASAVPVAEAAPPSLKNQLKDRAGTALVDELLKTLKGVNETIFAEEVRPAAIEATKTGFKRVTRFLGGKKEEVKGDPFDRFFQERR